MKRLFPLILLSIIGAVTAHAQIFSNPLLYGMDWPDPTVWQGDDGLFYSFATSAFGKNEGCGNFARSEDMVNWELVKEDVWSDQTAAIIWAGSTHCWAPQVVKLNGKWLMYITGYTSAQQSMIRVLSFDGPFPSEDGKVGPWVLENILIDSRDNKIKDNIDPFVQKDPATGKVWLFFGSTDGCYRVELKEDGLSLADNAEYTHVAGLTIEQDPSRDKVFEGIYLYYRSPYWYCFVSSGHYSDSSYQLKVGRSMSLMGPFVDKNGCPMTAGYAATLLSTPNNSGTFWGPGHNAEIFADADGRTYIYYHAHSSLSADASSRPLMLQRIYWDSDKWPYFDKNAPKAEEICPNLNDYNQYLAVTDAEWATMYVPFTFEVPEEMRVYEVRVGQGSTLDLTPVTRVLANRPYLVHTESGMYPLTGHRADAVDGLRCGDLVGSHNEINVPIGAYVLQNQNGEVAFYRVDSPDISMLGGRAYLQIPQSAKAPARLSLDELNTIDHVICEPKSEGGDRFYSVTGQRLDSSSQAAPIIVQHADGTVQKSISLKK